MRNTFCKIFAFLGIVFLSISCREFPSGKPFIYSDGEIVSYFSKVDIGTVFIYRDTSDGLIDTMILESKVETVTPWDSFVGVGYDIRYRGSLTPKFFTRVGLSNDGVTTFQLFYTEGNGHRIWNDSLGIAGDTDLLFFPKVRIGDTIYSDVIRSKELRKTSGRYSVLWFARDVGLVRKEFVGTSYQVFDLIELHKQKY